VKLVSKSGTQYNHMTSAVGYASSSLGPVHFGLGPDDKAESIEIRWPSGIVQVLKDVPADRIVHATEPRP
jgi:enediyne biosynthesis protein E4